MDYSTKLLKEWVGRSPYLMVHKGSDLYPTHIQCQVCNMKTKLDADGAIPEIKQHGTLCLLAATVEYLKG